MPGARDHSAGERGHLEASEATEARPIKAYEEERVQFEERQEWGAEMERNHQDIGIGQGIDCMGLFHTSYTINPQCACERGL